MVTYILFVVDCIKLKKECDVCKIEQNVMHAISEYKKQYSTSTPIQVGVLVSGGVDSMVLLHSLNKLKENYDLNITVLNVLFDDYPSHEKAYDIIKRQTNQYSLKCIHMESRISHLSTRIKETARKELKQISFIMDFDLVFTGHHQDDQIETILFRFLRGSGPEGLRGMQLFTHYNSQGGHRLFCKPFLEISKNEIITYAKENNIPFITDETNLTSDSDRNFIRNEILPKLSQRFELKNILDAVRIIQEHVEPQSTNNIDIYEGEWAINDLINLSVLNRVFVIKEYFRVVHGFTFNKGIHKCLSEALSKDLSNFRVYIGGGFEVKRKGKKIVVDYVKSN